MAFCSFRVAESHIKQQPTLEGHGLAIFYCTRKAPGSGERTAIEILRSLIAQLSWSADYMNVPKALKDAYSKAHASSVTLSPRDEVWRDIFAQLLKSFTRTTIILDALDECLEHESLLDYLRKTHDEVPKLHIFATCRLDVDVAKFFPAFVDVQVSDYTQKDISSYIRNEIRNRMSIFNDGKHANLQDQLITELEAKAQGM
jgi:ankyrin repeat domain-containing protein 50